MRISVFTGEGYGLIGGAGYSELDLFDTAPGRRFCAKYDVEIDHIDRSSVFFRRPQSEQEKTNLFLVSIEDMDGLDLVQRIADAFQKTGALVVATCEALDFDRHTERDFKNVGIISAPFGSVRSNGSYERPTLYSTCVEYFFKTLEGSVQKLASRPKGDYATEQKEAPVVK